MTKLKRLRRAVQLAQLGGMETQQRRVGGSPWRSGIRTMRQLFAMTCLCMLLSTLLSTACQRQANDPARRPEPAQTAKPAAEPTLAPADAVPKPVDWTMVGDDPNRWLLVEKVKPDSPGGWAGGTFHDKQNKIEIRTTDVAAFAIDTARIRVNWQKPVVLAIDDAVSELRRREHPVIHLKRDDYGKWVVVE